MSKKQSDNLRMPKWDKLIVIADDDLRYRLGFGNGYHRGKVDARNGYHTFLHEHLYPRMIALLTATASLEHTTGQTEMFLLTSLEQRKKARTQRAKLLATALASSGRTWKNAAIEAHVTEQSINDIVEKVSELQGGMDLIIKGDVALTEDYIRGLIRLSRLSKILQRALKEVDYGGRPRDAVLDDIRIALDDARRKHPDLLPSQWLYHAKSALKKQGNTDAVSRIELEERKPSGAAGRFARKQLERYDDAIKKMEGNTRTKPLLPQ